MPSPVGRSILDLPEEDYARSLVGLETRERCCAASPNREEGDAIAALNTLDILPNSV
ncbi:hypothetical protein GCM10007887_38050 [Methylobacterium haplocladii]|uniref:Uncharacterized protein n=1 Tax=Methylobacterium haplocladii TaxID=1176176 RepID=A0A512IW76_9HYPH|nr:hypothetical protein MHA02_42460 [Methylobacterium haplocladii]GLS61111.1 hypothetical protein GCM10007887_38050 [Methylobacterium haplocladii]